MMNELFLGKKQNGNLSWWQTSDKKYWFVTGTFYYFTGTNPKFSRAALLCHGQNFRSCYGHFSLFRAIFLAIFSRATRQFSPTKYGIFVTALFQSHGYFSKSVTDKPKIVTRIKKHCSRGLGGELNRFSNFSIFPHNLQVRQSQGLIGDSSDFHVFTIIPDILSYPRSGKWSRWNSKHMTCKD